MSSEMTTPPQQKADGKRDYVSPRLLKLGALTELTQGTTSRKNDPGGAQNGKT